MFLSNGGSTEPAIDKRAERERLERDVANFTCNGGVKVRQLAPSGLATGIRFSRTTKVTDKDGKDGYVYNQWQAPDSARRWAKSVYRRTVYHAGGNTPTRMKNTVNQQAMSATDIAFESAVNSNADIQGLQSALIELVQKAERKSTERVRVQASSEVFIAPTRRSDEMQVSVYRGGKVKHFNRKRKRK